VLASCLMYESSVSEFGCKYHLFSIEFMVNKIYFDSSNQVLQFRRLFAHTFSSSFTFYILWRICHLIGNGSINTTPQHMSSGQEIRNNSIDWAQLSRFYLKTWTESSLRNVVLKNKQDGVSDKDETMDNVQKHNICSLDFVRRSNSKVLRTKCTVQWSPQIISVT
jgi:hypothetical protein